MSAMPTPTPAPGVARCAWCSAELPGVDTEDCPACHAQLVIRVEQPLPGLTEVVPAASADRRETPKRSRILSWISGEVESEVEPSRPSTFGSPGAFAPPTRDVRREILRLRLEAEGVVVDDEEPAAEAAEEPAAGAVEDAAAVPDETEGVAAATLPPPG